MSSSFRCHRLRKRKESIEENGSTVFNEKTFLITHLPSHSAPLRGRLAVAGGAREVHNGHDGEKAYQASLVLSFVYSVVAVFPPNRRELKKSLPALPATTLALGQCHYSPQSGSERNSA
jgi:hypothetical protein